MRIIPTSLRRLLKGSQRRDPPFPRLERLERFERLNQCCLYSSVLLTRCLNVARPVAMMLFGANMALKDAQTEDELTNTSTITLDHYNRHADSFWKGTRDHDVTQNRAALLDHMRVNGPFRILDFGCGPGRDLKAFKDMGHEVIGLDGAERFVEIARDFSGCEVWHQDFLGLELPEAFFDGIFANASLFHIPSQELPRILKELWRTLKRQGVLFSSNPRGDNQEGWNGERYGAYYDLEQWRKFMTAAGFTEITHYYRPPGVPRAEQPWLASLWRKPDSKSAHLPVNSN